MAFGHSCSIFHCITRFILTTRDVISNANSFCALQYHIEGHFKHLWNEGHIRIWCINLLLLMCTRSQWVCTLGNILGRHWIQIEGIKLAWYSVEKQKSHPLRNGHNFLIIAIFFDDFFRFLHNYHSLTPLVLFQ